MKKKSIFLVLIITVFVLLCSGCTVAFPRNSRQSKLKNVVWKSNDNSYGVTLEFTVYEERAHHFGKITLGESTYDIAMVWWNLGFDLFMVDYYGKVNDGIYAGGGYSINKNLSVELNFGSDYIFGGALCDKTLTVEATNLENTNCDVALRQEVCWETEDKNLKLYTFQAMRYFSVGSYLSGDKTIEVVAYWLPDYKFEVYEIIDGVQQSELLFGGQYTCAGDLLELSFENENGKQTNVALSARDTYNSDYPEQLWYPATQ